MTMAELQELGVAFVVPGSIDMSTAMGKMLAHFLGAVSEFERSLIRERVRSGLANARAKGKQLGRPKTNADKVEKGLSLIATGYTYKDASSDSGVSISSLVRARRKLGSTPSTK